MNDKPEDANGMLTWPCGTTYKGNFTKGVRQGRGVMCWPSGDKYVGEWRKGKRDGEGDFFEKGGKVYTGQWVQDKPSGKGRLYYPDGTKFVGHFNYGIFVQGECLLPDGSKQIGEWSNNGPSSPGLAQTSSVLTKGKWLQPDGSFLNGLWDQNKLHGLGESFHPTKGSYIGEFFQGMKHGLGVVFGDGNIIKEKWEHGQLVERVKETDTAKIEYLSRFAREKMQTPQKSIMSSIYHPCASFCDGLSLAMKQSLFSGRTSFLPRDRSQSAILCSKKSRRFRWTGTAPGA